jgi:hypothetical protein
MSLKQIIQESMDKNPLGVKEALEAELQERVRLALEAKMSESDDMEDDDEDDDDEDDDDEDDDDMDESFELDEASVKKVMGMHQVIHKGKPVATYVAKYEAQDHAKQINDEERRNRKGKKNESFNLSDLDEAVTDEKHISSGKAQHGLEGRAEMKAHADHMQKKHGVTTKFHGGANGDELSYHGPKANVKKAIVNHYDGDHEFAKEEHPHLWK